MLRRHPVDAGQIREIQNEIAFRELGTLVKGLNRPQIIMCVGTLADFMVCARNLALIEHVKCCPSLIALAIKALRSRWQMG